MPVFCYQGQDLHYQDQGEGAALLFGHSYLWDHRMWREQVAALGRRYRCIVPDLWGHGASDPLLGPDTSLPALAEAHAALMAHLGISRYAVIGLSVGGMWGAELALRHPQSVSALVLMDTFLGAEPPATQAQYFQMLALVEQAGGVPAPLIEQLLPIFLSPQTRQEQPLLAAEFRQSLAAVSAARTPSLVALGRAIFARQERLAALAQLQPPTLVMVGEQDRPRPVAEAQQMAAQIPGAHLAVIPGAGHISALEQPQAVNARLQAFLDQAEFPQRG